MKQRIVAISAAVLLSAPVLLSSTGCAKKDADTAANGAGYYTGPAKAKGPVPAAGNTKGGAVTQ